MPMVYVTTSKKCSDAVKQEAALALSHICAKVIGKPESYVQALVNDGATGSFGGKIAETAFVVVKSIGGLNKQVNSALCAELCACLKEKLGLAPDKIYIQLADVKASEFGWNSSTFG